MKYECAMPTEEDIDWVLNTTMAKHFGGIEGWWDQHVKNGPLGPRDMAHIMISVWEAGRIVPASR